MTKKREKNSPELIAFLKNSPVEKPDAIDLEMFERAKERERKRRAALRAQNKK